MTAKNITTRKITTGSTIRTKKNLYLIIFLISLAAMVGSLYFSNYGDPIADIVNGTLFQGPGLPPCSLCRWGRILMYPIVLLSGLGLIRKSKEHAVTTFVLATFGFYLAAYHTLIQHVVLPWKTACDIYVPCDVISRSLWTYITLPSLELIAFIIIAFAAWKILKLERKNNN